MTYSEYIEQPPITADPDKYHSGIWKLELRAPLKFPLRFHVGEKEDCESLLDSYGTTQYFFVEELTFEEFIEWENTEETIPCQSEREYVTEET